jgi:hypothetical protein
MGITNRKTIRTALKTAILTDITTLQAVYGYYPKDLGGQSPVCTIETLPSQFNLRTNAIPQEYSYAVTFWALTDGATGSGMTAADAEDVLDDLHYALVKLLRKSYNAEFFQASEQMQFTLESGNVYQSETHFVRLLTP